ncbi:MAG: hypothetical protein ACP5G2_06110 [Candidatus Bipolaricaulaceae bacterium]
MRMAMALAVVVSLVVGVGAAAQDWREPPLTPLVHGAASLLLPGLGQYLNGEYDKALTHFLVDVALVVGASWASTFLPYYFPSYLVITAAHTLWALHSAIDAYQTALQQEGLSLDSARRHFALAN